MEDYGERLAQNLESENYRKNFLQGSSEKIIEQNKRFIEHAREKKIHMIY